MIGSLRGKLLEVHPSTVLVDVQGIGYELQVPLNLGDNSWSVGQEVFLYTDFIVREDSQVLIGFDQREKRDLFRQIIKINGVGAKVALAIISTISIEDFLQIITGEDIKGLCKVPGIGNKLAKKILLECHDWLVKGRLPISRAVSEGFPTLGFVGATSVASDAIDVLVELGYGEKQATKVVQTISQNETDIETCQDLIKRALSQL